MGCGACGKVHNPTRNPQGARHGRRTHKTSHANPFSRASTELDPVPSSQVPRPKESERDDNVAVQSNTSGSPSEQRLALDGGKKEEEEKVPARGVESNVREPEIVIQKAAEVADNSVPLRRENETITFDPKIAHARVKLYEVGSTDFVQAPVSTLEQWNEALVGSEKASVLSLPNRDWYGELCEAFDVNIPIEER